MMRRATATLAIFPPLKKLEVFLNVVAPTAISAPWDIQQRESSSKAIRKLTAKKARQKSKDSKATLADGGASPSSSNDDERARLLFQDEKHPHLNVGPNGSPLFTSSSSISQLSRKDTCSYIQFRIEKLKAVLREGLPVGMLKEFEDSRRTALLVRHSFLDLRDNFRRVVDPTLKRFDAKGPKVRKQIVLDGPLSCGKSIALSMLVYWAREEGWLVFYVPKGREWTHGGFRYKNLQTGLWDTPDQATNILKDFLKGNESCLQKLSCQITDRIPLGEGAGIDPLKGVDSIAIPEKSTLYDLCQMGVNKSHAAVGVVVRLRKELSLVEDVPVLIAIDQYNNWFTFSEYEEPVTIYSCRPVHAREVATVNAFRPMKHDDMMVGAFTHSTAVGKLRKDLPNVPIDARVFFPRYTLDEGEAVCHYYLRQRLMKREAFTEENWKKVYHLCNGNGVEMRSLLPLMNIDSTYTETVT